MWPLKAKAIIPRAFMAEKTEAEEEGKERGEYEIEGGLSWLTERIQTMVE